MSNNKGFTLIEMMIVVAIIGVLASIATPAFLKYVKQSKVSEVSLNLKNLGDGASSYYQADHYRRDGARVAERQFPTEDSQFGNASRRYPPRPPKGTKQANNLAEWTNQPWKALKFAISKPHYYSYGFFPTNNANGGDMFEARGEGDLDGDGITSVYLVRGNTSTDGGEIELTPVFSPNPETELE